MEKTGSSGLLGGSADWKILRKMRMTMLLVLFGLYSVQGAMYSQNVLLNIKLRDAKFDELVEQVTRQSEFTFFFNHNVAKNLDKVSVELSNATIEAIMDKALESSGYTYRIKDRTIIVFKQGENSQAVQAKTVHGTVVDSKGAPLPGATVLIKGTNVGVSTDMEGKFEIQVPDEKTVLVVSFIGYRPAEVAASTSPLKVVLQENVSEMDEVVVTGYQTMKKRDVTGSVTTIKAEDLMMPAYTSIDQMLQGRVAGLMVMNTSSRVGTSPKIQIRGTSTILGNGDPVWVVDGIVQPDPLSINQNDLMVDDLKNIIGNQISWLNPSDIETVTVLKDASATAIYGSKAANGVIVITTKKGSRDNTSVNYSSNFSLRLRPNYDQFNYMDSHERIRFSRDMFAYGATYSPEPVESMDSYEGVMRLYMNKKITKEQADAQIRKLESANTDWLKILTRNSFSHNHNLSISGGSSKVIYNASIGYGDNSGVEKGNDATNMSGRLHIGASLHPKVYVDLSLSGSINKNKGYAAGVNPLGYATSTSRSVLAYNEDGSNYFLKKRANYPLHDGYSYFSYNILNELENSYSQSRTTGLNSSLDFKWNILPELTYEFVGGYYDNVNVSESYAGEDTYYVATNYRGYDAGTAASGSELFKAAMLPFGGELYNQHTGTNGYNIQNKLLYSKTWNEMHRINAVLGVEVSSSVSKSQASTIWGYIPERAEGIVPPTPLDELEYSGPQGPDDWGVFQKLYNGGWRHSTNTTRMFSMFATFAYSLKNRYVFNASIRNDASNRFGQDQNKRLDPTYSFGLSWDIAAEPWMEGISNVLNQFNLRATYGIQGNSLSSISPDVILREDGLKYGLNEFQVALSSLPNPNLKWERTKSWNFGIDLQLLKWISMNVEYYGKRSNVIISQELGIEYGLGSMPLNGGMVTNSGVEYTLNMTPIRTNDWAWTIGLNSSKNWNEMKSDPVGDITLNSFLEGNSKRVLKKGYPLSAFWSYSYKGLNPENGVPEFNLLDREEDYEDYTELLTYSGQLEPNFTGGLSSRLRWKGLTLGMDFALIIGAKKRLPHPYPNRGYLPDSQSNLDRDLLQCWKKPGDVTDFPAFSRPGVNDWVTVPGQGELNAIDMWSQSDIRVVNASFLRCRQLSLNWQLNNGDWCKKMGIKNLTINASVNNLFVICSKKFNGFDPELDNSVQPKIFSFGLNIGL